jgi:acetylornithine deacetylase/succinyl-diaminopimelate desuccinylase-like protein
MDERPLAERLITYDTSTPDGLRAAAGFVKGWLQSHEIDVWDRDHAGLPVILADVGAPESAAAPNVILHGHLDVVPGHAEQFAPRVEGDRLIGRGAYDMKGVSGKAAHGSTPWLGDNAVLKAVDVFRAIESLPFSRQSSELFDRPSINLGRILGGDALNKVPDACIIDIDVRYLPEQDPGEILAAVRALPDVEVLRTFVRVPAHVSRTDPYVGALRGAVGLSTRGDVLSVGRDGASDAVSFLEAGIPAVEFGPSGAGHHGPDEWVSLSSLRRYREALGAFVAALPGVAAGPRLRAVPGGAR